MNRLNMSLLIKMTCIGVILLAVGPGALAQERWQFQLTPYAWLAGLNGRVAPFPALGPADVDVDFYDDIVGNINGALFFMGEARKGRLGIFFDGAYTDIEDENATPGPLFSSLTLDTRNWMLSAAGLIRLAEQDRSFLDAFAGVRYWSVENRFYFGAGAIPARFVKSSEDWVDPIVGLKGRLPLGRSPFFINGGMAVGGFGAGSDFVWDANLNLGYQWTDTFSTTVGYRYLDVDYAKSGFVYDVVQEGMIFGFSWGF